MYKENLSLNNLQWLICHKTQSRAGWRRDGFLPFPKTLNQSEMKIVLSMI